MQEDILRIEAVSPLGRLRSYRIANILLEFLISTSLFLAINGSLKIFFSETLYNMFALSAIIITFLITFSTYGLNKLTDLNEDTINLPERANTIKVLGQLFKYSVIFSYMLSIFLGFLVDISTLPVLFFPLILGTLYSLRLSRNVPRLKDIAGVKNITIALTWSVGSTFLPLVYLSETKIMQITLIFYLFFLKSYINSILFDVRDIKGDSDNGIRTIPVYLGIKKTRTFLLFLNTTFIPWLLTSYFQGFFSKYYSLLFFSVIYGYGYILHFCREGKKIGKSLDLLVDGEWIPIAFFALVISRTIHF